MPDSIDKYLDSAGLDESVFNIRQLTEGLEAEMQDLPYARPDGLYPEMTVGAVIGADETAQWATRESTGSGGATVRSVQGAAVGWNQTTPTINNDNWLKNAGVTATFGDGTVRMAYVKDGTTTASSNRVEVKPAFYAGHGVYQHKYLMLADITPSKDMQAQLFLFGQTEQGQGSGRTVLGVKRDVDANVTIRLADIVTETSSDVYEVLIGVGMCGSESRPVLAGDYADVSNAMLFDLTTMFGAGNEPATVAEFEQMFPEPYYPYSAPTLKPVRIAGISSTDAQGGELDAIEWPTQTLRAAGSVADMLYNDHVAVNVGVYTFTGNERVYLEDWSHVDGYYAFSIAYANIPNLALTDGFNNLRMAELDTITYEAAYSGVVGICEAPQATPQVYGIFVRVPTSIAANSTQLLAWLAGKKLYYKLTTPTTTPISPALPMTYKVQAGGSESVIVPAGEVSAAPVLTVAEPVNAGDEFARIWAAIESLGYTRNAAQLSRPVSLTDIGSIDEVQKDTTKEVTE